MNQEGPGSVVVSVDAELGWGYHDLDSPPAERLEAARPGWATLIDLFEEYEVPATWAVVGHLLLETCDGIHGDHPAPSGWFAREREEWADRPDLRFGRGLVDDLLASDVAHDVGCHSFSHAEFGDPETKREFARAEVEASVDSARERGLHVRSFVFPRNNIGHRDVLADAPFTCYRGHSPVEPAGRLRPARKLWRVLFGGDLLVQPDVDEYGLVNVPRSLFLFGFEGLPRTLLEPITGDPIVRQVRRGLEQASQEQGLFHVTLHPNDLIGEKEVRRMEAVLSLIETYRRESSVEVETMGDVADRVLTASGMAPRPTGVNP